METFKMDEFIKGILWGVVFTVLGFCFGQVVIGVALADYKDSYNETIALCAKVHKDNEPERKKCLAGASFDYCKHWCEDDLRLCKNESPYGYANCTMQYHKCGEGCVDKYAKDLP